MKKISILLILGVLLSSCATMINGAYQEIPLETDPKNEIYLEGIKLDSIPTNLVLKKDKNPKEIIFKRDGFKDEQIVLVPYKRAKLTLMSFVPFGILIAPPIIDLTSSSSIEYDENIVGGKVLIPFPNRPEGAKEVQINQVSFDIHPEEFNFTYYDNHADYLKQRNHIKLKKHALIDGISINRFSFTKTLNESLTSKQYIDTLKSEAEKNFLDLIYLNAVITDVNIEVSYNTMRKKKPLSVIRTELKIKWQVLDAYRKEIFSQETNTKSGEYGLIRDAQDINALSDSFEDAIEYGMVELLKEKAVKETLYDTGDIEKEASFETIHIPKPSFKVENLNQAIRATVTVRVDKGHGSGFFISNEGHLITNYHVVGDHKEVTVILNDKTEYKANVLRVSKLNDLALLKVDSIDTRSFEFYPLEKNNIEMATDIYAVGTPSSESYSQTVSKGIISGVRENNRGSFIQIDASVNPGNSGGPIVNKVGQVFGVVSSKLHGFGIEGVAFGIPVYKIFPSLQLQYNNTETP